MILDDPGPAIFEADPTDEYRLSFTVPDADEPGGRRTLMTFRCFEEDKLRGAIVWLGEQQHLWREWCAFAQAEDGATLATRLTAMATQDSIKRFGSDRYLFEMCTGASARFGNGHAEIDLCMTMATRELPIITHAFRSDRLRDAFMGSLSNPDRAMGCVELAEIALLRGRTVLARRLDSIAIERLVAASIA